MSRRPSDADRAVREAWEHEKQLVLEGKGTRDWTPDQQKSIIDKGKAYDDDGRAFEGQHMKSVAVYPEYQGNPDNIQFLTKEEHLEAHKGNWQNPTNWYYDPVTKEYTYFGVNELIPCAIIELNNPVYVVVINDSTGVSGSEDIGRKKKETQEFDAEKPKQSIESPNSFSYDERQIQSHQSQSGHEKREFLDRLYDIGVGTVKAVKSFNTKHPHLSGILKVGFLITAKVAIDVARKYSGSSGNGDSERDDYSYHIPTGSDDTFTSDDLPDLSSKTSDNVDDLESSGTPKSPHLRRGYLGHRWKNNEEGDLELTETWINETFIHKEQDDNE